ncbi:MAG: alpha-hydroxy-acid oxidizing protein [Oscillospiraceae bacterium]|nr:alpha-hydroxy-acid oxidizing protein [Oscillospiraceae bacterium]
MDYNEILKNARETIGPNCHACPVCNGVACGTTIPGPGAKGSGDGAIRNFQKWREIRVNMDTLHENRPVDASLEIFGRKFRYPIFAAPVASVHLHYGPAHNAQSYNNIIVSACAEAGVAAFCGDEPDPKPLEYAVEAMKAAGGIGVPTLKPWDMETIAQKMELVAQADPFAVAMDVDGAGLPFLKGVSAGPKTVEQIQEICRLAGRPYIAKGIMTAKGALKALEGGAAGIVVSNHGGRVQDQCPATAEVLEEIVEAVDGRMKIFVDGGLRSGVDVFKALALGADGVLICRPFVTALYGGGAEGVKTYINKLGAELEDTMLMCGAFTLDEITRDMVRR